MEPKAGYNYLTTAAHYARVPAGPTVGPPIVDMFPQDGLTGSDWGDWSLYPDFPRRASDSELGMQAPLGYWDPGGHKDDESKGNFIPRRLAEIKRGRMLRLATMGYITPDLVGKFPAF